MKNILRNIDKKLLITTIVLFAFGLIMIFSASNVTAYMYGASLSRYFLKQLIFITGGIIGCLVLIYIPTSKYKKLSWIALIVVSAALLTALIYSSAINNTTGWILLGEISIQPSEFCKVIMIMWLSSYYGTIKSGEFFEDKLKMIFPLFVAAIITFLIMAQNDYGTAFVFFIITMVVFFLSPASKKIKKTILIIGLAAIATLGILLATGALSLLTSDKLARFNFKDPCSRYLNEGNQVCNSYIAINNGGIFGKGLGDSTQKYLYLPESHTDFIFAIIVEETGLIGGLLLILAYIFVLTRIVIIGVRAKKNNHALMCYGIAVYLFLHMIINLGGVMGIIPITGIPLPFMSYGGSFAVSTLAALTIVQRICYENKMSDIKQ